MKSPKQKIYLIFMMLEYEQERIIYLAGPVEISTEQGAIYFFTQYTFSV